MPSVEAKYGAPLWVAHRADLQRVLREGCEAANVTIRTGARVTEFDFAGTRIRVGESEWIEADVILAADGEIRDDRVRKLKSHASLAQVSNLSHAQAWWRSTESATWVSTRLPAPWIHLNPDLNVLLQPTRLAMRRTGSSSRARTWSPTLSC